MTFPSLFSSPIIICGFYTYGFSQQTGWTAIVQAWGFRAFRDKIGQCRSFLNLLSVYFWLSQAFLLRGLFSSCSEQGRCVVTVFGPSPRWRLSGRRALGRRASAVVALGVRNAGSVAVAHGLSCSRASGISLD